MQAAKFKTSKKRKPKIQTKGKQYCLDQSPLYQIKSKKKLAELFSLTIPELKSLVDDKNYKVFFISKDDGSKREIQAPHYKLDILHAKIASYLSRLTVPEYLHSGIKGRSHITNAKVHLGTTPVLTMDIQKFYPSISKKSIYHFYQKFLDMEPDIAGLLAELCSYKDKLPTGSRLSMPLAYWANHQMYDALLKYCNSCNVKMSVYVDDLTFSGLNVNRLFKSKAEKIVEDAGLKVHPKKTKLYKAREPKLITGVVINGGKTTVRNKHHKAIYNLFNEIDECKSEAEWTAKYNGLVGRLNAAGQVDPQFKQRIRTYKQTAAHLTKDYK